MFEGVHDDHEASATASFDVYHNYIQLRYFVLVGGYFLIG